MATPVKWLTEFQVNTGTADVPGISDPQTIGLSNGNYLVAWVEPGTAGIGTTIGTDIIGVIFDAEGNLVETAQRLNTDRNADDERDFDIAATNDGGFIMVYVDDDISNTSAEAIYWERFDATGTRTSGAQIATNAVAADFLANPKVVVNNNDNTSYVTFTDDVGADTDISAVRVSSTGVVLTPKFSAAQNSSDFDRNGDTAINSNGELVSIYEEDDSGTTSIELRVYSTSGVLQHAVTAYAGPGSDPHVATLTNGNIVATWVDGTNVKYSVFDSNLLPDPVGGGPFNTDSSPDTHNEPEIVALPDGGFVIVWDNDTDNTVEARRLNENGSVSGTDTVFVIEGSAGSEVSPDVGVTGDGRILFAWEDTDNVFSNIWDTRGTTIDALDYAGVPLNFINGDVITSAPGSSTVNGDSGNDTILGQDGNDSILGNSGVDVINGGAGNDTIEGGLAKDIVDGGSGNDTFIVRNGEYADDIQGGVGDDTLDLSNRTDFALTIDLNAGTYDNQNSGNSISNVNTIIGTQLGDTFTSTFGIQTLDGQDGDDLFIHGDGQFIDNIAGGAGGGDTLDLSAADEAVDMNLQAGTWTGLGGTRSITGIETVIATQGNDTIISRSGTQTLDGQGGNDFFFHGNGQIIDNIDGGVGVDTLDLSAVVTAGQEVSVDLQIDSWTGSGATRTLNNIEIVRGTQLGDTFRGNVNSEFFGNGGNDTIIFGSGDGTPDYHGDSGTDTADFSLFPSINFYVDLDAGGYIFHATAPGAFSGDLTGFENYEGGGGIDILIGNASNNIFDGNNGNDEAFGGLGSDTLRGDEGSDNLRGEAGADVLSGGDGNDIVNGGDGEDLMFGGSGNDLMFGGIGFDRLYGGTGTDKMYGGDQNDIANGGGDNDVINTGSGNDLVFGQSGNDLVFTQIGNDNVFGGIGNDKIFGGDGNDDINGGDGNDQIFGGAGIDTITGANGNDTISGGGDGDIFIFAANKGADVITDYTGADKIDISAFGIIDGGVSDQDWRDATLTVGTSGGGADVTITWDGGGSLTLETTGIASLTDVDFLF